LGDVQIFVVAKDDRSPLSFRQREQRSLQLVAIRKVGRRRRLLASRIALREPSLNRAPTVM
jgi:hypothetical protein